MSVISICIDVTDAKKALEFYTQVLNCEIVEEKDTHAKVKFRGVEMYLIQKEEDSIAVPDTAIKRSFRRHWTPVHIDFKITNSEEAVAKLVELGGSHEGTRTGDWGRFDFCSDPFGNGFCLSNLTL